MKIRSHEVFEVNARLCQAMANPRRLMMIDMLGKREQSVGEMAETLEIAPATVSQHLRVLRDNNIVKTRKEGQTVYYSLAIPRMMEACHIIREMLLDSLKQQGAIAADLTPETLIVDD